MEALQMISGVQEIHSSLEIVGIEHEYIIRTGTHDWAY